jgi:putative tricarboxylic transport membrane protein
MLLLFQYFGIRAFVHVLRVPQHILAVVVAILCVIGSFAIRNSFVDVYVMIGIGLLGYLLMRARIPVTPIILGLVLGPTLEREFRTALILSEGSLNIFYTSMPAMLFFGLTILIILFHFIGSARARPPVPKTENPLDAG